MCKRYGFLLSCTADSFANTTPDLQNCPLKSLRPTLHDSGNRKRRRAAPTLPIRRLRTGRPTKNRKPWRNAKNKTIMSANETTLVQKGLAGKENEPGACDHRVLDGWKKKGAKLGCNSSQTSLHFRLLVFGMECKLTSGETVFLERWDSAALAVIEGLVRIQQL
jgi:hypothetical protein